MTYEVGHCNVEGLRAAIACAVGKRLSLTWRAARCTEGMKTGSRSQAGT